MASKNKPTDYKKLRAIYKKAGMLKADLRTKEITAYQKRKIRELEKEKGVKAAAIAVASRKENPALYKKLKAASVAGDKKEARKLEKEYKGENRYNTKDYTVRKVNNKKAKLLKDAGIVVKNGHAYIPQTWRTEKTSLHYTAKGELIIEEKTPVRTSKKYISTPVGIFNALQNVKLKDGQSITIGFGGNSKTLAYSFDNIQDLENYINNFAQKFGDSKLADLTLVILDD